MQTTQDTRKFVLSISDISCSGLPRVGRFKFPKHQGSFYVEATIAGDTRRTDISEPSNNPSWKDTVLNFDLDGGGQLVLQVIDGHRAGKPKLIGTLSPIEITDDFQDKKTLKQRLVLVKKDKGASTINFTLARLDHADGLEPVREQMELAAAGASRVVREERVEKSLGQLSGADKAIGDVKKIVDPWQSLLTKVRIVVGVGKTIAQIHPYAQMVWSILSPVLEAIKEQVERDERIVGLVGVMDDAYFFVDVMKPLEIEGLDDARKGILKQMLQQTYDCAWFIRGYTSLGFFERGVTGVTTSHDKIVEQYTATFRTLKEHYKVRSLMKIELTIHRTLSVVEKTHDRQVLDGMAFAADQGLPKECLPGTRETITAEIIEWINRPSTTPENPEPCVYWLHGVAGCGKTAIASSIVRRLDGVRRCARYFFDASRQSEAGPRYMFSTLSRNLADLDAKWRESLVNIVESSKQLQTTLSVTEQFENFIVKPAAEFRPMGPILIVIDALDESGSKQDRAQLLQMLGRLSELGLHGHFRFLITSRPEDDIQKIFKNKPWVVPRDLADADKPSTDDDIRLYVREELSQAESDGLTGDYYKGAVDLVVSRAEHLFQWAFIACSYIRGTWESSVDPVERYENLRDDRTYARLDKLDELYTKVLRGIYGPGNENDKIVRFRKVLWRVLSVQEPLSLNALTELDLQSKEESEREIKLVVRFLGSLLKGVNNHYEPIQPLHASFREFLLDPKRSIDFYVGTGSDNRTLAQSSLLIMNKGLQFNICHLETSYLQNRDVKNLSDRIRQNIPEHLSYACRYFAEHIGNCEFNENLFASIVEFLNKKLLFWLEALGLLKNISRALTELLALQTWVKNNNAGNKEVEVFIGDAIRFVQANGGVMETSTPHIYLSLITFIPPGSPLHEAYSSDYPRRLKVASNSRQSVKWTSMLLQIPTSGSILAVKFSPNGNLVVSGSSDSTVRVWDVHTGQPVGDPFQGHTSLVTSVGFSPDGNLVVFGSSDSTVRVWDVHTGQPVGDPFQGHTDLVTSVGFSPDGNLVVSGSYDSTVRVWDVHTGQPVGDPFQGHTSSVTSVGFSPDGNLVVSGSHDETVRVYNMQTRTPFLFPDSTPLSNIVPYTDSSIIDKDGWIQGPSSKLLFWVPPSYRTGLWRPCNIAVIGRDSVKLDLSQFAHGTKWHQCRKL